MSGTGNVLETGNTSVFERIAGLPLGWSPLEWIPGALPDHGPTLPLRGRTCRGACGGGGVPSTGGTGKCH